MARFAHLAGAVESHHFDLYYDATLGDDEVRRFIERANPEAAEIDAAALPADDRRAGYWTTRRNSVVVAEARDSARSPEIEAGQDIEATRVSTDYERDGAAIYRRSFAIIRAEAELARFAGDEESVAVRIIHASGMVEIADDIVFRRISARSAGEAALRAGAPIFCDAQMVATASRGRGCRPTTPSICTLSDPRVAGAGRRTRHHPLGGGAWNCGASDWRARSW